MSLVFIALDHRSETFHRWREQTEVVLVPLQDMVSGPIKLVHWIASNFSAHRQLITENAKLRTHEFLLESKLQKLLLLERENAQLKELLKSTARVEGQVRVAQLMAISLDPSLAQVVLNKGSRSHVYVGQPVLDAYGVMGQVVDVSPYTSKVMLITDSRAAVPVRDMRNDMRAIAVGRGVGQEMALVNVPDTTDIQVGDVFVSSGLGLRFPVGYPVGTVTQVKHVSGQRFAQIALSPAAHLNQSQQVLLAWPTQKAMFSSVKKELEKPLSSLKATK